MGDQDRRYLKIYLQDHLAGAAVGVDLAHRLAEHNEDAIIAETLEGLAREIEEDRDSLLAIMDALGFERSPLKEAGGWLMEKAGRLKLNGELFKYSPLSRLVEFEGLTLGVTGKLSLWWALLPLAETIPELDVAELERLAERATTQRSLLEELRRAAAELAFAPDLSTTRTG
ncbi:MAG: hypothetical protein QOG62_478 [Thermoleophilaceae bacterium]|jgi:hypothetical protein|nr:hypothetical protein [Thermoleophilaceae bacterium]